MINIDTIYQRVLTLANKEQRGYITPQEFNLLANQAQLDIFEQYFYDINQFSKIDDYGSEYSDSKDSLDGKIAIFQLTVPLVSGNLPDNLYRLGTVVHNNSEAERVEQKELLYINISKLAKPTVNRPLYTRTGNVIQIYNGSGTPVSTGISCNYIRKPHEVEWGYNVVVGKALSQPNTSVDFELHSSEETKLVIKILELAGIVINKPGLISVASQKEASKIQQEKA